MPSSPAKPGSSGLPPGHSTVAPHLHPSHPDYRRSSPLTGVVGQLSRHFAGLAPAGTSPTLLKQGHGQNNSPISREQEQWAIGTFWQNSNLKNETMGTVLATVHGQKGKALSLQSLKAKLQSEFTQLLKDKAFREQFVEFCVTKNSDLTFQLPSNNKLNELFNGLVDEALGKGCNPSAAAQFIVKVNDNGQEKFVLLVSTSARRGDLIQASNGALENGESLGEALQREAVEELNLNGLPGNSVKKLLMQKPTGMRLGGDITDINAVAKKIALGKFLYLNVATVFSNDNAILLKLLKPMVAELNQRFQQTNPFYQQAVDFVFGEKKTAFNVALNLESDKLQLKTPEEQALAATTKTNAQDLVQRFLNNIRCKGVITPAQFKNVFDPFEKAINAQQQPTAACIKACLLEIIDLAENTNFAIWSEQDISDVYQRWVQAGKEKQAGNPQPMKDFENGSTEYPKTFDAGFSLIQQALGNSSNQQQEILPALLAHYLKLNS